MKVVFGGVPQKYLVFLLSLQPTAVFGGKQEQGRLVDICGLMLKRSLARNRVPNNFLMMLHGRVHAGSALDERDAAACEEVSVAAVQKTGSQERL